jgi:ADP-heptose:LPS heptosyltransferase
MLLEAPGWIVRSALDRNTITLLRHRMALGDTLMLTALIRGLKKARPEWRVAVATRRPDVFLGNPYVDEIRGWHLWRTPRTVRAHYTSADLGGLEHVVQVQWRALWKELQEIGVPRADDIPELDGVHPELILSEKEKRAGRETLQSHVPADRRNQPVILMISGGKRNPVHNREWGEANYQAVADALAPHATVMQLGGDVALKYGEQRVPNLGGRAIRETGALLSAADAVLLQEGGLHHLARAVEAPTVVIYGGSVRDEQTGYDRQLKLINRPPCSPCFGTKRNCMHLKCMTNFTPRRVLQALTEVLEAKGKQLPVDAMAAAADRWIPPDFVDRALLAKELEADRSAGQTSS